MSITDGPVVASGTTNTQLHDAELRRSLLAPVVCLLYRILRANKRRRLGGFLIDLIQRFEGRQFHSLTARYLMERYHGIRIGAYSYGACFSPSFRMGTSEPLLEIGRYTSIGPCVEVYSANHPFNELSTHPFFYERRFGLVDQDSVRHRRLSIGHDVWIGARVLIMSGCGRIGTGAVIGAGSVVTHDVPEYAIIAGVPAKLLRYRFDQATREKLLELRWWENDKRAVAELTSLGMRPLMPDIAKQLRVTMGSQELRR